MKTKQRVLDDVTSFAAGAFSILTGIREELSAVIRNRTDNLANRFNLAQIEEVDVLRDLIFEQRKVMEEQKKCIDEMLTRLKKLEVGSNITSIPSNKENRISS